MKDVVVAGGVRGYRRLDRFLDMLCFTCRQRGRAGRVEVKLCSGLGDSRRRGA